MGYDNFFNTICRVCLVFNKSEKMVPLIDNSDQNGLSFFAKAMLSFANIVIEKPDGMPTFMCFNCLYLLKQAINFKLMCESNDECLKNIAKETPSSKSLKEKIVEYIMFKLYFPMKAVNNSSERKHAVSNINPESKQLIFTDIISDDTYTSPKGAQLNVRVSPKRQNINMKPNISSDNFDDDLNLPIVPINTLKRKKMLSDIKSESKRGQKTEIVDTNNKMVETNLMVISIHDQEDKLNLSADCILDKLELQFASTSNHVNHTAQISNISDHSLNEDSNKANKKFKSNYDLHSETIDNLNENSLDNTPTHNSDNESNISVDCILEKLESSFNSKSKKLNVTEQKQNVMSEDRFTGDSNYISADCMLDKLHTMFASKYPLNTVECERPLKRKKLKVSKKYREKRKKVTEKQRSIRNNLVLVCNICDKVLANRHTFEQHMQRHNGCRYICEHCGKGFPVLYELQTHQVSQHGTGPHLKCSQCPFKAARKFDLIEHERIHSGERPYTCDKCGLTFRRRGIWRKHLIYHTEKSVQCPHCPRKFFQRSEMLAHANNIHDRVYVYLCSKCGATYAKSATVRRHMTERHGIAKEMQGKVLRINKGSSYNEQ